MVIDFEELLNFDQGYTVAHLHVDHNKWMTDRTLRDLRLADEGVLVLNVQRASGAIIGTPAADTALGAGDRILTYGRHECLEDLRNRPRDPEARSYGHAPSRNKESFMPTSWQPKRNLPRGLRAPQRGICPRFDPMNPWKGSFTAHPMVFLPAPQHGAPAP